MCIRDRYTITYDEWLQKYKGKGVHQLTLNEHTAWHDQYKKWRKDNIEKVS